MEVVSDPTASEIASFIGQADSDDVPILAAASINKCHYLLTFNVKHYRPEAGTITVLRPGEFLLKLRQQLLELII